MPVRERYRPVADEARDDTAFLELESAIADVICLRWDVVDPMSLTRLAYAGFRNSEPDKGIERVGTQFTRNDAAGGVWELRDAPTEGFSGGPVVGAGEERDWQLVGMVVARLDREPKRTCSIPAATIQHRLGQWNVALPGLSGADRADSHRQTTNGARFRRRGTSPFYVGVIIERAEDFVGRERQLDEIRGAIADRQPVQLLGEALMGKSSLLRRVRDELLPPEMAVACVDARGQSGWSARELVLAMADELDRRSIIDGILAVQQGEYEGLTVMQAMRALMPCALLLDNADAIANKGHRFQDDFFDNCRALTDAHQLLWISASRENVSALYHRTESNSEFLNNSKTVFVGHLDRPAIDTLLGQLSPQHAKLAYEQASGWALGLQWLGNRLWHGGESATVCDDFANAMVPRFARWWRLRSRFERSLLRRLVVPKRHSELSDKERRCARTLVARGLVGERESDGSSEFFLPGKAWQRWVSDVE